MIPAAFIESIKRFKTNCTIHLDAVLTEDSEIRFNATITHNGQGRLIIYEINRLSVSCFIVQLEDGTRVFPAWLPGRIPYDEFSIDLETGDTFEIEVFGKIEDDWLMFPPGDAGYNLKDSRKVSVRFTLHNAESNPRTIYLKPAVSIE